MTERMTESQIIAHIGARLRALREAGGLTQLELAYRIKVTPQQVSKAETGRSSMSANRIYAIARALEISPAEFFRGLPGGKP